MLYVCAFLDCKLTEKGGEYTGKRANTESGVPCINWDFQTDYPPSPHNYCRNPASSWHKPWCYTNRNKAWGNCNIPFCGEITKVNIIVNSIFKHYFHNYYYPDT